jgi:hypothetical protein
MDLMFQSSDGVCSLPRTGTQDDEVLQYFRQL